MTYLTVPIAAKTIQEAISDIATASSQGAQMVELRLDYLTDCQTTDAIELIKQAKKLNLKTIVTCRDISEGGQNDYTLNDKAALLIAAIENNADFIDCEYHVFAHNKNIADTIKAAIEKNSTRLILSIHNFKKPFDNIQSIYDGILSTYENAIPKIAYKANHINDCFQGFDVIRQADSDVIVLAMGADGLISRLLAKKLGALVCFASLDEKKSTAPGQVTIEDIKRLYRYDSINKDTEIYGIIAEPVGHSLSPAIHNKCFEEASLNKVYLPILVKKDKVGFDNFMQNILQRKWLGFKGFSVTVPHKQNAINFVQHTGGYIEELAATIGATNTLTVGRDKRISSYNTDYAGALDALVAAMSLNKHQLQDKTAAVLGAGGVSRAVVAGLVDAGVVVTIYNRTFAKAKSLAHEFSCHCQPIENTDNINADILVNCTSLGMSPDIDTMPVSSKVLKKNMTVFDTVYNPAETMLLQKAKKAGAKTVSGVEMFIGQAVEQFKHFTNQLPDEDTLRKVIEKKL